MRYILPVVAIVAAAAMPAQQAFAQTTTTVALPNYDTWGGGGFAELGAVALKQKQTVLNFSAVATLVDQGWGYVDPSNGLQLALAVDNNYVWLINAVGADHTLQTVNYAATAQDLADLNSALGAVNWASNPNVRVAAIANSWGYPGWQLHMSNASFSVSASGVPEPASWGMMLVGFGLMGAAVRHRKATVRYA